MAGARNEAKIKFNADCKDFNAQIKSANAYLKELRSEVNLNATSLKGSGDQISLLNEQYKLLQQAVDTAGDKVEAMRGKVEAAVRNYGEGSDEVAKWRAELANAETQQERFTQQLNECAAAIDSYNQQQRESESATAKIKTSIQDQGDALEKLKAEYVETALQYGENTTRAQNLAKEIEQLSGELKDNQTKLSAAEQSADSFDQALDKMDDSAADVSDALSNLGGVVDKFDSAVTNVVTDALRSLGQSLQEIGKFVINTGIETETSFAKVQAVSSATTQEMADLRGEAERVGKTLPYTLKESGDAYYYMGLAGYNAEQMMASLEPTLQLVTASGEDLSAVSDIVTDNITAFGMSADQTKQMVDVMAQTMRSTNTDVGLLGETFKYAAAPAHAAGYALEDVALAAGLMANNGIKGSQAGTSLRQMFQQLAKPTEQSAAAMEAMGISLTDGSGKMLSLKQLMDQVRAAFAGLTVNVKDADGNLRSYEEIIADLEGTTQDYTAAEKLKNAALIFGTRAMSGVLSIVNMSEAEYQRVTNEIYNYNDAAQEMALTMQDTLQGDIDMLNTSLSSLASQLFDNASPALRDLVQTLTDWVQSDQSVELINSIASELTELLQGALANLPQILDMVMGALQNIPSLISAVTTAIQWVTQHIDGIITAIKAVLAVWALIKAQQVVSSLVQVGSGIVAVVAKLASLTGATTAQTVAQQALNVAQNATPWGAAVVGITAVVTGLVAGTKALIDWVDNTKECGAALVQWTSTITPFTQQISACRAQVADISNVTGQYGHTVSEVDSLIAQGETMVTQVIMQANEENRALRESEIEQIRGYNEKLAQLQQEKMGIYKNAQQDITISIQAEQQLTQQELAQYAADIQAAEQQTQDAIRTSYGQKATDINNYYRSIGQYNSQAHLQEIQANQAAMEQELADSRAYSAQSLQLLTERAAATIQNDVQMWASLDTSTRAGREQMIGQLGQLNSDAMNAFLTLAAQTQQAGGTLDANTRQMITNILSNFNGLPKSMQDTGRDALLGLINGMDSQITGLEHASEMTCDEIVTTVCSGLQIGSPSRVMYGIGQNTVQGVINGMNSQSTPLTTTAKNAANTIVTGMTPEATKMTGIGSKSVTSVISGLNSQVGSLNTKAQTISKGIVTHLTPSNTSVTDIGENIMTGINSGMNNKQSWLGSKISSLASGIVTKFKNAFDIHSPSKLFEDEIGAMLPAGIGEGIEVNAEAATKPLKALLGNVNKTISGAQLGDMSLDVTSRLDDHMSNVGSDDAMLAMMDRMIGAVSSLATRAVELYLDGRMIATTTAPAADQVNGSRLDFMNRGLAL